LLLVLWKARNKVDRQLNFNPQCVAILLQCIQPLKTLASTQQLSYSAREKTKQNQRVKEALESSSLVSVPYRLWSLWCISFLLPSHKVSPLLTVSKL